LRCACSMHPNGPRNLLALGTLSFPVRNLLTTRATCKLEELKGYMCNCCRSQKQCAQHSTDFPNIFRGQTAMSQNRASLHCSDSDIFAVWCDPCRNCAAIVQRSADVSEQLCMQGASFSFFVTLTSFCGGRRHVSLNASRKSRNKLLVPLSLRKEIGLFASVYIKYVYGLLLAPITIFRCVCLNMAG
jgi:hypothetical protein